MAEDIKILNGRVPIDQLVQGEAVNLDDGKYNVHRIYEGTENQRPDLGEGIAKFLFRSLDNISIGVEYFHIKREEGIKYIDINGGSGTIIIVDNIHDWGCGLLPNDNFEKHCNYIRKDEMLRRHGE